MSQKAILCTHSGLFASAVLETLLKSDEVDIVGVVNSTRIKNKKQGSLAGSFEYIHKSGLTYAFYLFCITQLAALFQTVIGRKGIAQLARRHNIPLHHTRDINSPSGREFVRSLQPDILLTAYFNQLVEEPLLSQPPRGCINIHPSLLPFYRGADPVFHAILRGENKIGVTVHRLDQSFDTGDILAQESFAIEPDISLFGCNLELFKRGAKVVAGLVPELRSDQSGTPQSGVSTYDSWPSRGDVVRFLKMGRRLVSFREYLQALRN